VHLDATNDAGQPLVLQRITNTSDDWLEHKFENNKASHIFRYTNKAMKNDRRASYDSEKYPWLLMAGVYPHIFQRPSDFDTIRVEIPRKVGNRMLKAGHYIVHYRWKGYGDCVDVNVHDTQMDTVDGEDEDAYIWNKIEHCQYLDPHAITSQCHIASGSPDECVKALTGVQKEQNCGFDCKNRYGVNVVPMINPSSVMFPELVNIPWVNGTCANTEWTKLTGAISKSEKINWNKWDKTMVDNVACTAKQDQLSIKTTTLRQAVLDCTRTDCGGFAYRKRFDADEKQINIMSGGTFDFVYCTIDAVYKSGTDFSAYKKTAAVMAPTLNPERSTTTLGFAFTATITTYSPTDVTFPENDGVTWARDIGDKYSNQNGVWFGWHCSLEESGDAKALGVATASRLAAAALFKEAKSKCSSQQKNPNVDCVEGGWLVDDPLHIELPSTEFYLKNVQNFGNCADGVKNHWEVQVSNGVYEVVAVVGRGSQYNQYFVAGCSMENTRLHVHKKYYDPKTFTINVEVTDGKFTFEAPSGVRLQRCEALNSIQLTRIADRLNLPWLPVVANPKAAEQGVWWQMKLAHTVPVGLVTITSRGLQSRVEYDCRVWWMFKDSRCPIDAPLGTFPDSGVKTGAIISISDTPCSEHGCPPLGQHVCGSAEGSPTASIDKVPFNDVGVASASSGSENPAFM
jgi:hypothetical protein